jgi:hypothetical protein
MEREPAHESPARARPGAEPTLRSGGSIDDSRVRVLLRKLRDLNLRSGRLAVNGGRSVRVDGCLSMDSPVEGSLRYSVQVVGGAPCILELAWRGGALELDLWPAIGTSLLGHRTIALFGDDQGRAAAPAIRARLDPESTDEREIEHFLRRLVRAAFGPLA